MKIIRQLAIILSFSLLGELLHYLIPLPVPASIYGLCLLFAALCLRIVKPENIKETTAFLAQIMPLLFIPASVGIMCYFDIIQKHLAAYLTVLVVTTILIFAVSGRVTQRLGGKAGKEAETDELS